MFYADEAGSQLNTQYLYYTRTRQGKQGTGTLQLLTYQDIVANLGHNVFVETSDCTGLIDWDT